MRRLFVATVTILICGAAIAAMSVLRRAPDEFWLAPIAVLPHGFSLFFILMLYWCGLRRLVVLSGLFVSIALLLTTILIYIYRAAPGNPAESMFAPGVYFLSIILSFATVVGFLLCLVILKFVFFKRDCSVTKTHNKRLDLTRGNALANRTRRSTLLP